MSGRDGCLNVTDYGAIGDGITDCTAAVKTALATAAAINNQLGGQQVGVYFPPGHYIRHCWHNTDRPWESDSWAIGSDVEIIGAGSRYTTLEIVTKRPAFETWMFRADMSFAKRAWRVALQGMTLRGPGGQYGQWDGQHSVRDNKNNYAVWYQQPSSPGGVLRLRDVTIDDQWQTGVQAECSNGFGVLMDIADCDISSQQCGVSLFSGEREIDAALHMRDTYLRSCGTDIGDNPVYGRMVGHGVYIHPTASHRIRDCRFGYSPEFAVHHYSSGIQGIAARYAMVSGCIFDEGAGPILTAPEASTLVSGCTFLGGGVAGRGWVTVSDSAFHEGTILKGYDASLQRGLVHGCQFRNAGISLGGQLSNWDIGSCAFEAGPGSGVGDGPRFFIASSGDRAILANVHDCHFSKLVGRDVGPMAAVHGTVDMDLLMRHCEIRGVYPYAGVMPESDGVYVLTDNSCSGPLVGPSGSHRPQITETGTLGLLIGPVTA